MKTYSPFLLLVILVGCGQIQSERKDTGLSAMKVQVGTRLSAQEFASHCANKPGTMLSNNTCAYEIYRNTMLDQASATMTESIDYPLKEIPSGSAVYAVGSVAPANTVEILVGGAVHSGVPSAKPVTTSGGMLAYRFRPGQLSRVQLYVYACYDNALNTVRCVY